MACSAANIIRLNCVMSQHIIDVQWIQQGLVYARLVQAGWLTAAPVCTRAAVGTCRLALAVDPSM